MEFVDEAPSIQYPEWNHTEIAQDGSEEGGNYTMAKKHTSAGGRTSIGSNTTIKRATPRHIRIGRADWIVCTAHWFLEFQSMFPETLWQGVEPLMTLGVSISKTEIP